MSFKHLNLFLSLLLLPVAAFAQTENVQKITIEEAVVLAADNNISLKEKKLNLELAEKKNNMSVMSALTPSLSVNGGYNQPFTQSSSSYSVSATAGLNISAASFTSIQSTKLSYEQGIISYEEALRAIELNVRKVFYNLIYTKANIELQKRNLETAKQRYELNLDKYNRGQLSELDLLSSQYTYESMIPNLDSLQISYNNSMDTFKQTLGINLSDNIELAGSLDDVPTKINLEEEIDIESIPSVQSIKNSIESAELALTSAQMNAYSPVLSASYSFGKSGTSNTKSFSELGTTSTLSVSVKVPLDSYIPSSSTALNIESSKTNIEELKLQLENAKTSAMLSIENSKNRIKQEQLQLQTLQSNVELAQKTYNMTLTAYNAGSKDLLSLHSAADSLKSAQISLQSQKYTLICEILDLENTLGVPFGTLTIK